MPRTYWFATLYLCLFPVVLMAQDSNSPLRSAIDQAASAYHAGRYAESASHYEQALAMAADVERKDVEYRLACAQALAGNRAAALESLRHAVEHGYVDRKSTESEADLKSLHDDPAWPGILERMSALRAAEQARWGDAAFATPYAENISDTEKLAGLAELWAQAKYGFANFWHVPDLNWDKSYMEFIPQVLATHSTSEYYRVLMRFYALLQDGHSRVLSPDQIHGKLVRLPLRTRLIDGRLLVIGSRIPSADLQGIQPGDEVVSIQGEPAMQWAEHNVSPYVSASSLQDRAKRVYESDIFLAPIGTTYSVVTETPAGVRSTHPFTTTAATAEPLPRFVFKVLPGNVVYVALNGFDNDSAAMEWEKHWPQIAGASAIILDMRENGGGSGAVGYRILSTLIDKPTPKTQDQLMRWVASYHAWGQGQQLIRPPLEYLYPDQQRHYDGPVAMLISSRTISAAEDTAAAFVQMHRGKLLGEATSGTTGEPLLFKLPGGGMAYFCTKHDTFADGSEFIGVGIRPDVAVSYTRHDILTGRDPVLEEAMHLLAAKP